MSTPPPSDSAAAPSDAVLPAMDRLRERIEAAVAEIERLRTENASLAERVQELGADAVARGEAEGLAALALDGDPDQLRKKVETFIEAIDMMLAEPSTPPVEAESEASSESAG